MNSLKLNKNKICEVRLGKKGAEKQFLPVLEDIGYKRVNARLHDFENPSTGGRIELKKQADQQWLDPSKFHHMTKEEANTTIMFVMAHKKDKSLIESIHTIKTIDFINLLCGDEACYEAGWSWETINLLGRLKKTHHPKLQPKAEVRMRKLLSKYPNQFSRLY